MKKSMIVAGALALLPVGVVIAGWERRGVIGQSGTTADDLMPDSSLRVVADKTGTTIVGGKWYVLPGETNAHRLAATVYGTLVGDGERLYSVEPYGTHVRPVRFDRDRLVEAGELVTVADAKGSVVRLAIAPSGCRKGFCARAKFATLDLVGKKVCGNAADGASQGTLLDYAACSYADLVRAVGFLADTGDLLLATGYPEYKTHRFAPDGQEVKGPLWPAKAQADDYGYAEGRTWALAVKANPLSAAPALRDYLGYDGWSAHSIAFTGKGYWLGTTKGALYFDKAVPRECARRLGGPGAVDALQIVDGRVFAFVGDHVVQYWLDDRCDEAPASDSREFLWRIGPGGAGKVTATEVRDKVVYLLFDKDGEKTAWTFDWRVTLWAQRDRRWRKLTGESVRSVERPSDFPSGDYTAWATEDDWLAAYSPSRMAICVFRRTK